MKLYEVTITRSETTRVEAADKDSAIDLALEGEGIAVDDQTLHAEAEEVEA